MNNAWMIYARWRRVDVFLKSFYDFVFTKSLKNKVLTYILSVVFLNSISKIQTPVLVEKNVLVKYYVEKDGVW